MSTAAVPPITLEDGTVIEFRPKLKMSGRRAINAQINRWAATPLGRAIAEGPDDVDDDASDEAKAEVTDYRNALFTEYGVDDLEKSTGINDVRICAWIASATGPDGVRFEVTPEWLLDALDEDEYAAVSAAVKEADAARAAASPSDDPDPDPLDRTDASLG